MDQVENGIGKSIDEYIIVNNIDKSYILSNNKYFHLHSTDDGFDYTIYDCDGILIDGGVFEYDMNQVLTINKVLKEISKFTGIKELLDKRKKISNSVIEQFEKDINI